MKIALNGASGFVGTALQQRFKNHVILNRHDNESDLLTKLEGVDLVINLAGAPIIKRWTDAYKQTLIHSRIDVTRILVSAINKSNVSHFVSTSAIGIYPNDIACDESYKPLQSDFLSSLAKAWEYEALKCKKATTILRFGVILGKEGGALAQMSIPFKLGLGGTISNGKMMFSWIHIKDLINIYEFIISKRLTGTYNATSPHPVSNYLFTKALGNVLHRPTILPLPKLALKLIYAEASRVLTDSKEVYPRALEKAGFDFAYTNIESALDDILS